MDILWQDLRQAARLLARKPGFTAVVVLALALGIGPNTAIFSAVRALLLTPPPYHDPDSIVIITQNRQVTGTMQRVPAVSSDDFQTWRRATKLLEQMAMYAQDTLTLTGHEEPVRLTGARVSPALFPLLRVNPLLGRTLQPDEERAGNDRAVVLSYSAWAARFGKDEGIVDRFIKLDGNDYRVVGVMPQGFEFPNKQAEYWTPMVLEQPQQGGNVRRVIMMPAIARLRPGVSIAQAEAEGTALLRPPAGRQDVAPELRGGTIQLTTLQDQTARPMRPALLILMVSVALVLLIACSNVANLLLSRAVDRRKEIAIRASLGSGRGRLVRQMLTESMLLSLLGGAAGLLLGFWCIVALPKFSPSNIPGLDRIHIDGWTLAITFGLSLFTGLLFGLAPALHCARADLTGTLKEGEAQASAGLHLFRRNKARSLLVMAEFGLALMLLVGAGLLANSFLILIRQKPGYNPEGVLALQISLPRARYPQPDMQLAFFDQLLQALRGVPGVQSAGSANLMPMTPAVIRINFRIPGHPESTGPESMPSAGVRLVSPGYLQTMGTRIISGRDFSDQDRENAAPVVIVNESMVRRWFSGANPIGRQVDLNGPREVIAVVEDVKPQGLDSEPQPELYLPHRQSARMLMMGGPANAMNVVVRTGGDPLTLVSSVRARVGALDPQIPIFNVSTLKQRVSDSVAQPRFYAVLLGIFAGLALVLAAVGIYGVFSYHVSQCRREIGIRMALGAQRANLFFLILRQGILLACVGVATGLAGAWAVNSFLSGFLFGISPTDPATYAAAAALMVFLALLASYLPARRAMAVDPVLALRQE